MTEPLVTVIVPVWNDPVQIVRCLEALARQTLPRDQYEVIVVDNGSTDGTAQAVRAFDWVRLIHEPNPGSYAARNAGLREASGGYVAFTDADCVPRADWLEQGLGTAKQNPEAVVIGGRIELFRDGHQVSEACALYEELFAFRQEHNVSRGHCITANWLSPLSAIAGGGGFNQQLLSGGDVDLSRRMKAGGGTIVYADAMVVAHPVRASHAELVAKRRRVMGGLWMSARARGDKAALFLRLTQDAARQIKKVATAKGVAGAAKWRVAALVVSLWSAGVGELSRLSLGAAARRS